MKIYLVAPRNPESFSTFDRVLPTLGKQCVFSNLSLPTVAALTPPAHEVVLCDENVEPIDFGTDADIVGITGYVVHKTRMFEIADEFRRRGKLVVAGGPFASVCPEELRERVDVLFIDEVEGTWPRFLEDHATGRWQSEYRQHEKPSLRDSPMPRFDLLKIDRYRTVTLQFARGCPFSCDFCEIIVMYGRQPRTKSVGQALAEISAVYQLGVRNVFIADDNFIGDKEEAKVLLAAMADWQRERGHPIEFMTQVSLNVAQDDALLTLLREANFALIFVGIESPRRASLADSSKAQNLREDILMAVHRIQAAGIQVMAGMIVGFDTDDASIFEEQFRFIQDARIPLAMTGMLNALPLTPLHARLKAAGRLVGESAGDQFVSSNIVPRGMSRVELHDGYQRLLSRLYSYWSYRQRAMALILRKGAVPHARLLAQPGDIGLFVRVLWHCVLRASPRRAWFTLSLIGETALRRPRAVRDAVTLALLHKHVHEYTRHTSTNIGHLVQDLRPAAVLTARPR